MSLLTNDSLSAVKGPVMMLGIDLWSHAKCNQITLLTSCLGPYLSYWVLSVRWHKKNWLKKSNIVVGDPMCVHLICMALHLDCLRLFSWPWLTEWLDICKSWYYGVTYNTKFGKGKEERICVCVWMECLVALLKEITRWWASQVHRYLVSISQPAPTSHPPPHPWQMLF